MKSMEIRNGGTGHSKVEVARDGEVGGKLRIFEVPHASRSDASLGKPIVEPRGGAVAEIGADRLMDRCEHLEQDKHGANQRKRPGKAPSALDCAHEAAHGDGEHRRQHASQDKCDPPGHRETVISLRQDSEELPFITLTQAL